MLDSDAESARTLTLVALILQILFVGIFGIIFLALGALTASTISTLSSNGAVTVSPGFMFGTGIFFFFFAFFAIIGILWIFLDYFLIYKPLSNGQVHRTETSALVLSILQIFFGGVLPGILLLIAWIKIRDSLRFQHNRNIAGMN